MGQVGERLPFCAARNPVFQNVVKEILGNKCSEAFTLVEASLPEHDFKVTGWIDVLVASYFMHIRWKNVYVYQLYRCLVMHTPGDSERHIFMVNDVNKRIYSQCAVALVSIVFALVHCPVLKHGPRSLTYSQVNSLVWKVISSGAKTSAARFSFETCHVVWLQFRISKKYFLGGTVD